MAARFGSLFRGPEFEDLPEELRELLAHTQRDMTSMRELVTRMETASRQLKDDGKPLQETQATINDISTQLDELRARADAFDDLPTQFASLARQSQELASSQEKASNTIERASQQVGDLEESVKGITKLVTDVSGAREELAAMSASSGLFSKVRESVNQLRSQLHEAEGRGQTLREALFKADVAKERTTEMTELQIDLARKLEALGRRADSIESEVDRLRGPLAEIEGAKKAMRHLTGPKGISSARAELQELRDRMSHTEHLGKGLSELERRLASGSVEVASKQVAEMDEKVSELRDELGELVRAKQEIDHLAGPTGLIEQMRGQTTELREQHLAYRRDLEQVGEKQSGLRRSNEDAIAAANEAIHELTAPDGAVSAVRSQLDDLRAQLLQSEGRADALRGLEGQLSSFMKRANDLADEGRKMSDSLEAASKRVAEIDHKVSELDDGIQSVAAARQEIEELTGPSGAVQKLRGQAEELHDHFLEYRKESEELRQAQSDLRRSHEDVLANKGEIDQLSGPTGVIAQLLGQTTELREQHVEYRRDLEQVGEKQSALHRSNEDAIAAANEAIRELTAPDGTLSAVRSQLDDLRAQLSQSEVRADVLRGVEGQLDSLMKRANDLADEGRKMSGSLEAASKRVAEIDHTVSELDDGIQSVAAARQEIEELTGPSGAVQKLRGQAEELHDHFLEYRKESEQLRQAQSDLRRSHDDALSRHDDARFKIDVVEERTKEMMELQLDLATSLETVARQASGLESELADLRGPVAQLGSAKEAIQELAGPDGAVSSVRAEVAELRDRLTQSEERAAALRELEGQIATIAERANALTDEEHQVVGSLADVSKRVAEMDEKVSGLRDGMLSVDAARLEMAELTGPGGGMAKLRGQAEELHQQFLGYGQDAAKLEQEQSALRRSHESALSKYDDIRFKVDAVEERAREMTELQLNLAKLLETVSHMASSVESQVAGLRDPADAVALQIDKLTGVVEQAATRVSTLEDRMSDLSGAEERLRGGMERIESSAAEISRRVERIDMSQGDVQEAIHDLSTLRQTREEIRDALEKMRSARVEVERVQADHAETKVWLSSVQDSIREVKAKASTLDELAGSIDYMRRNADRVAAVANNLETRGESLEALDARVTELLELGTKSEERARALLGSLADADQRFQAVVERAGRADELRRVMSAVAGEMQQVERRIARGQESAEPAPRPETTAGLAERVDRITGEIDRRQIALAATTESIHGVTEFRREAAEVVRALENQVRTLSADLRVAEEEASKVADDGSRPDGQEGSLRLVDKRLIQFEEKLAQLDSSLRATARDEVREAHDILERVQAKRDQMTLVLAGIDTRRRRIEEDQQRPAKAYLVLMDIRGELDALQGGASVDQVTETTGKLTHIEQEVASSLESLTERQQTIDVIRDDLKEVLYTAKQTLADAKEAERLIATLRRERKMTQRIREALREMLQDQSAQAS